MVNNIIKSLENKSVAILGFGIEGKSTYNYIRKYLPSQKLYILDRNENLLAENQELMSDYVEVISGPNYLDSLSIFDTIIKSPGIVLENPDSYIDKITSQMGLVLEETSAFVIGVTGTKGKSTTSSLIYEVLKDQGVNVILAGNIGLPILDYVDEIKDNTIVVSEFSSYQLEYLRKSPRIGIILNLYEEHLDHHKTIENYYNAKLNIFKYQTNLDYSFYFKDNEILENLIYQNNFQGNKYDISFKDQGYMKCDNKYVYCNDQIIYDVSNKRNLIGMHNVNNIMFALAVANVLNLDMKQAVLTINGFKPLKHRLECIGTYNEITFYDDAIATIPEACINAITSIGNIDTLIFGGMDRGINYDGFAEKLLNSSITNFICLPDTGKRIAEDLNRFKISEEIFVVEEMEEAVKLAYEVTAPGTGCLLSPAAPSYNKYKNFAEKGDHFVELIEKLK